MTKNTKMTIWKVAGVVVMALVSVVLTGWAVQFYWNTFLVPAVMSVHVISIVHALGLSGLVNLLIYRDIAMRPERTWDDIWFEAKARFLAPLFALAFGLLYRKWM